MPRVLFTADPKLPSDIAHLGYRKGMEVDLSEDAANRWLRRGVATIIASASPAPSAPAPAAPADASDPVVIPDGWQNQHHMARMALARRITAEPVENVAAADAVIAAEVARLQAAMSAA